MKITLRVREQTLMFSHPFIFYSKFPMQWGLKDMFIFGNKQVARSPVKSQSFIWLAEYADGTHLSEFDLITSMSNSFYDIDKTKVIKFGLLGENAQAYFDVGNGVFTVNNHRLTVSYEADGLEYPLTGRALVYNDLITYKDAISDASPFLKGKGKFVDTITQFNVGYKKRMELLDVNINFQCVLGIPLNSSAILQIKISSDMDLNGKLIFRRNGKIVDQVDAPLKAMMSGQIDWTIR